jgi:predicted NodU family carbamoyl transferase
MINSNDLILGISDSHDSGICVFKDNKIIYAINEERISRIKNQSGFPDLSIVNFLNKNGIDFEHISFSDHFNYSQHNIDKIEKDNGKLILTTEKDFQKIQSLKRINKWVYLEIKISFIENESLFNSLVTKAVTS